MKHRNLMISLILFLLLFIAYQYTSPLITGMVVSEIQPEYKQTVESFYLPQCDEACIQSGYTSGSCKTSCGENEKSVKGVVNCSIQDSATLVIGSAEAIETYSDNNPYIGEDADNPDWIWLLKELKTNDATDILDTSDASQHSGPRIGIKNSFRAVNLDADEEEQAKGKGGSFCLPKSYICIEFNATTVADYGTFKVEYTTTDLSSFDSSMTAEPAILIRSYDEDEGLKLIAANLSGLSADKKTDKVWITQNITNTTSLYYEDSQNQILSAGYLNFTNTSDFNIISINYGSTTGSDVEIDLRGDIAIADNLTIVFDIKGNEGQPSIDGNDDITIKLSHSQNGDFDGLGSTPSTAEADAVTWGPSNIQLGLKDEDHLSLYGIKIEKPDSNLANDKISLEIPADQVMAEIVITGATTERAIQKTSVKNITNLTSPTFRDDEISSLNNNILLVGGPVVNILTKKYIPKWEYEEGEAIIALFENNNTNDKTILVVAGTTKADTEMASKVLRDYTKYKLTGKTAKVSRIKGEIVVEQIEQPTPKLNIAKYPSLFIEKDQYNLLPVYGSKAAAEDVVSLITILETLKKGIAIAVVTNETQSPDQLVMSDEIALGSNLSESGFFDALLQYDDIATLNNGEVTLSGSEYKFREAVLLFQGGPSIQTSLSSSDDDYTDSPYMELEAGRLRYYHSFVEKIDISSVTSSDPLDIYFLDSGLSITSIIDPDTMQIQAKGSEHIMTVGDTITSNANKVTLVSVNSPEKIVVEVNNGTDAYTDIIKKDITAVMGNLQIKNVKTFYHDRGARCCCFNALIYLEE